MTGRSRSRSSTRQRIRSRRKARAAAGEEDANSSNPKSNAPGAAFRMPNESERQLLELNARTDFKHSGRKTFWNHLKDAFSRRQKTSEELFIPADDAVTKILSIPRGIARLDAFQKNLIELHPGTPGHRGIALAFHRELTRLAELAQMDLSLLKSRVEFCAAALKKAGESVLAAELLAKVGRKFQAAQLFLEMGDIERLEEAHRAIRDIEGGSKQEALALYERFEGLFLLGMRIEALEVLKKAASLWPENPLYEEIKNRFFERIPKKRFQLGFDDVTYEICTQWPLTIGRSNQAHLHIQSPLVSRIHLRLERSSTGQIFVISNVQNNTDVWINGISLDEGPFELKDEGLIDLRGVEIGYRCQEKQLLLWSTLRPNEHCLAPLKKHFELDVKGEHLEIEIRDEHFFITPKPAIKLEGAALERPLLLLTQDALWVGKAKIWVQK